MWNLPEHCKTARLGRKIAGCLGEVKECEIYEVTRDQTRFLKATVTVNIHKPLLKGENLGSKEDGLIWVDFRYERLPNFCYYCGVIGHEENNCASAVEDQEKGTNRSKNMGPWLKADSLGTKLNKGKMQNKSDTEEKKGRNALNLKKLEEKILEGLAKLTMVEGNDIEGENGSPAERESITATKLQETKGAQELNLTQNHKGTQEVEEPNRMIMGLEDIITGDSVETEEIGKQGKEENKEKGMSKHLKDSTNTMSTPTKVGTKMWKRQARQATAMTTQGKENSEGGAQKRKIQEVNEMELDNPEPKVRKGAPEDTVTTAAAAGQPCRDQ
ncbi:hypothetical protein Ahy_B04g070486 [Arachis hypogaea]|uniref:CCHC-type domain-containing protein n=1 Tax=Arachis hypogaea TaxID=3818 RepID=A0A444ZH60_ARAHY|nr:hypothetical protein Ahy_B04g070486 [Arachis hypogaea]